jgi:putative transposase
MSKIYLTDHIKVNPSKDAVDKLWNVSYICKDIWNILNDEKQRNQSGYYRLKKLLPELKQGCDRLSMPSSQVLQEVVKALNASWKMYFTKQKNGDKEVMPPRFKSYKYFFTQKYPQKGISFEVVNNTLRLAYGKCKNDWIEIKLPNREYALDSVKTATVSYNASKHVWYVDLAREVKLPPLKTKGHVLYFDPGCKTTLSGIKTDYTVWEYDINPLREMNMNHYMLIDCLKSKRDKKKRSSRQYRRLNAKIRRIYGKISTQSKHYLHSLANRILDDHPDAKAFMIGNWDKRENLSNTGYKFVDKRINRQVQNNNPLQKLIECLRYKAVIRGQQVEKFNETGTTETCSRCDYVLSNSLNPSVRVFSCPECGFAVQRDINSVLNVLKIHQYALWQGLRAIVNLSIARTLLNASSGKNRTVVIRQVSLNY